MNDFERRINAALQSVLNPAYKVDPLAAVTSAGLAAQRAALSPPQSGAEPVPDLPPLAAEESAVPAEPSAQAALFASPRSGFCYGSWDNPIIQAAMPLLLLVENVRNSYRKEEGIIRARIVREAQQFQQTLLKNWPLDDVHRFVYLLYSWIDETLAEKKRDSLGLTLGVEYYQNAWGGEKCFEHLQQYCTESQKHMEIIAFYDLILSLGFRGKYLVIERGDVLLADLRHQLDTLLYRQNPTQTLAKIDAIPPCQRGNILTPLRLFGCGFLLLLVGYGVAAWYLHDASRALRSAIAAWTPAPPYRINLMSTLPQPLPQILSEGWLEVQEDPRGWLLIFTSDGAFATGKSVLSAEFQQKRNIERLGEALAPWPGDLEVMGHTDSQPFRVNSRASNFTLSAARAETVADILREVMQPLDKSNRQILSLGKGDSAPMGDNATEEGRRKNRRVDILWKVGNRHEDTEDGMSDDQQGLRQLLRSIHEIQRDKS